jgi:HemY protein
MAALWGKAQEYLELAIAAGPDWRAHIELARVFESTGRVADAGRHYRLAALINFGA